jgi:hypothetical protein
MTLIGADGPIGEGQPAALPPADHGLDAVAEEAAGTSGVTEFARPFQIFPGDLERVLEQLGK